MKGAGRGALKPRKVVDPPWQGQSVDQAFNPLMTCHGSHDGREPCATGGQPKPHPNAVASAARGMCCCRLPGLGVSLASRGA